MSWLPFMRLRGGKLAMRAKHPLRVCPVPDNATTLRRKAETVRTAEARQQLIETAELLETFNEPQGRNKRSTK